MSFKTISCINYSLGNWQTTWRPSRIIDESSYVILTEHLSFWSPLFGQVVDKAARNSHRQTANWKPHRNGNRRDADPL